MAELFCNYNVPFLSALAFVLVIGLLEGVTTILGFALSGFVDAFFDFDADVDMDFDFDADFDADVDADFDADTDGDVGPGVLSSLLSFINVGKVPLLILLILFCMSFGSVGMLIQTIFSEFIGSVNFITTLIAFGAALSLSVPFTRWFTKLFSKILPKEETSVIRARELIGKIATLTIGTSTIDRPAEACVEDRFGRKHYIRVIPLEEGESFTSGTELLLVEKQDNGIFKAVKNQNEHLTKENC